MLQKGAHVLNATSIRHVLNARSVEHIGVCSTRLRAEWVRNRGAGETGFGVRAARRFVLAHGRQASFASSACVKPATTCKQLHEMSVAASLVGDVDA